jgi:hypothetical protein
MIRRRVRARECWCCGRELSRSDSRIAKRAREANALVTILREDLTPQAEAGGLDARTLEELDEFITYGERLTGKLLSVAHGELSATGVNRREMNGWGKLAARQVRSLGPEARARFAELRRSGTPE